MRVKENLKRLGVVGALAAAASTTVLTGSASADVSKVCSGSYFCNWTTGVTTYVQYVDAMKGTQLDGKYGYFQVFGPNGYLLTGTRTTVNTQRFPIRKSFPLRGLICIRYFEVIAGQSKEWGTPACTTIPI
ncbi:hypothetical protein [Amycolatopsis sp. NBC_01480]|jgi:hypothetical protein|uniref:hypothetical protein n=1 Tax=Amycolatopsis sp. NBC_01480 TaxID=2903562 RepID=UPI002E2E6F05|nr:hypothetical protein [Amycolatopsis sp. NBC_01480]